MTRQEVISNFIDSLERERCSLGLTQAQMAEKVNMSVSGYKKMIAGETSKIDLFIAYKMYELTGKWIFELYGDSSSLLLQTATKMRRLSPSQLRFVSSVIDFESDFIDNTPSEEAEDYVSLLTPTGSFEDGMIWDSVNVQKLNVANYRKRFGTDLHCAIRITSNHLNPVYNMGDILLISKSAPRDGDTGMFINRETGRAYFRRMHQTSSCILEPLNDYGLPFVMDESDKTERDKWLKFGRVLAKMRE